MYFSIYYYYFDENLIPNLTIFKKNKKYFYFREKNINFWLVSTFKPKMKKLYWSLSEVCELLSVEPHIIRYWESEISFLNAKRSKGGNRRYDKKLVGKMKLLKEALYTHSLTTKQASSFFYKNSDLTESNFEGKLVEFKKSKGYKEVLKQVPLTDLVTLKNKLEETISLLRS